MKYALTIALLIATSAHAVNGGNNGNGPVSTASNAAANAGAVSRSDSAAVASSEAHGGVATAEGSETTIGISEDHEAPAPAIAVIPPVSTMDCIRGFGIGGSNQNGAIALAPTWKDGDCMAMEQFKTLSAMDLYMPAASAYCSRKRFVEPFGTRADCEAQVAQALIDADTPQQDVRVVYWPEDSQCRESLKRCEATVGK